MWYNNYSVFVIVAEKGVPENAFCEVVRERAREVGAEALLFFDEPDGFLTAYLIAPATEHQRRAGVIIPFQDALRFILSREGYPAGEAEDEAGAEEPDLPIVYTERVALAEEGE